MPYFEDITGERFSRLTVVRCVRIARKRSDPPTMFECVCDCGKTTIVRISSLVTGHTKSCGCLQVEAAIAQGKKNRRHGMVGTRIYNIWWAMRKRCTNPKAINYANYGGRGINICDRWSNFDNFMADMGLPPTENHSIDRIDSDGNYEPNNCQWSTPIDQANNQRGNRVLTFNGESKTVAEWARSTGISRYSIYARINAGWEIEKALTTPIDATKTPKGLRHANQDSRQYLP